MFGVGWCELIQLCILITTGVCTCSANDFQISGANVYPSASRPLLVLLLVLSLLCSHFYCTLGNVTWVGHCISTECDGHQTAALRCHVATSLPLHHPERRRALSMGLETKKACGLRDGMMGQ